MDMRYGTIALGGIEAGLLNAAHAQIAQFLRIPSRGTGANTNSKVLDFQAGYEKMMTLMMPAMAGINMIFYPGTIEHAETISLESLVIDHEICSMCEECLDDNSKFCPKNLFYKSKVKNKENEEIEGIRFKFREIAKCQGCLKCVDLCPENGIKPVKYKA